MKLSKFLCVLGLMVCLMLALCACSSDEDDRDTEDTKPTATEEQKPTSSGTEVTPTEAVPEKPFSFTTATENTERMIREAVEQYNAGDYTRLDEPVKYYVLWLGFTHVTFGDLDFQMTDFDREYLKAVALNYEKSVESIADHNIDIIVDLHFVDEVAPLTQSPGDDWLYLAQETAMPYIEQYTASQEVDTVLTTVQTAGEENCARNESKDGYGVHDVILGLELAGITSSLGYSTFNLTKPAEGTYPLADPEIPSLYATAVAVHEWMHQLEPMKELLGVEYPDTHAYQGATPGYQQYINGANDYDFFEFYKLVLKGKLPYEHDGTVKLVGMYPKMWPLIKRNITNLGYYTIAAADGSGYLTGQEADPRLTLSKTPCVWNIRYSGEGHYEFTPKELPTLLIDLGNAWDMEGNTISLWQYTGYVDAQSWLLTELEDGSYYMKTPYPSGRVITVTEGEAAQLCTVGAEGVQKWTIEKVK